MDNIDPLFRRLQLVLDKETLGFPETRSGSDIRLLKQLFTPEQAKAVIYLTYKFSTVAQVFERAIDCEYTREELEQVLDDCARRGMIGYRKKDGVKYFRTIHYLLGMAEGGLHDKPKPEYYKAVNEFAKDGLFWKAFLATKVSQMRTIPIEQSIENKKNVASYDNVKEIVLNTGGPYVIIDCVCRKGAGAAGKPCKRTSRGETCMSLGDAARGAIEFGHGREISQEEALEILKKNAEDGLVLQPSNTITADFICSCCGCCCGIFRLQKSLPNPLDFWTTNFYAKVDADSCTACETCVDICSVAAVKLDENEGVAVVNMKRCIGCGNCVPRCPVGAIELLKKEDAVVPPQTGEDLNEVIMTNK